MIKIGNYILLDPKCEKVVLKPYIFRSIPVQHSGAAVSSQKGQK